MMVVRCMTKFELRRLCKAIGATAMARLGAPTPEEFGYCDSVKSTEIGDSQLTIFVNSMCKCDVMQVVRMFPGIDQVLDVV
jgi:T-complex protein 1 subunit theta